MTEEEKHALRKEKKSEEVLRKSEDGINMDKSSSHIRKDLYRAEDDVKRNFGDRKDKNLEER